MTLKPPDKDLELLVHGFTKIVSEELESMNNGTLRDFLVASYQKVNDLHEDYMSVEGMVSKGLVCKKCALGMRQKAVKEILVWVRVTENALETPEKFGL